MFILGALASVAIIVAWIWIVVLAFQSGDVLWGILSIVPCGPLLALVYGAMHFEKCKVPVLLMAGGLVVSMISGGIQAANGG